MKNYILEILERKKLGLDCTEQESAEIKMYIKETTLMPGDGSIQIDEDLQLYFPIEWSEAQDELNMISPGEPSEAQEENAALTALIDLVSYLGEDWENDEFVLRAKAVINQAEGK